MPHLTRRQLIAAMALTGLLPRVGTARPRVQVELLHAGKRGMSWFALHQPAAGALRAGILPSGQDDMGKGGVDDVREQAARDRTGRSRRFAQDGATGKTYFIGGLDTRDDGGPQNTDVMMLARIDEDAGTVRVLSIPRDLYAEIPGYGWQKINAAFNLGVEDDSERSWDAGIALVKTTFQAAFGVEIANAATVDFAGFPVIIDRLGGIDIDNPYTLYEVDGTTVQFAEGMLHLDGEEALDYVRHRHQDGDDGRVRRQQRVLDAILVKIEETGMNPLEFLPAVREVITTDLGQVEQFQLIAFGSDLSEDDLVFGTIEDQLTPGETEDGQWIYEADWETLPAYVQGWLNGEIVD